MLRNALARKGVSFSPFDEEETLRDKLVDARNDARLENALARLPAGSGFVFRHYHLDDSARLDRFRTLARAAKARDHLVIVARGDERFAGADGTYGSPFAEAWRTGLFLATGSAHPGGGMPLALRSGVMAAEAVGAPAFVPAEAP